MDNDTDNLTSTAIEEETAGPQTSVAPTPVKEQDAEPVQDTAGSVQSNSDGFVGTFEEPDYTDIISDEERVSEPEPEEPAMALDPQRESPAPVETPPVAEVPSPAPVATQSVETPPAAPVAAPAPEPAPTPSVTPTPEEQAAALAQLEQTVIGELQKLYALSPEEAAKLDEFDQKPSEYLPRLLARAHQNSYAHAYQAIMQAMPDMVQRITTARLEQERAENAFFTRWPDLKGQDEVVLRAIKTYRQMNPKAPVETAIEQAGVLAMISLGKTPGVPAAPAASAPTAPTLTPARPVMPGGGTGVRAAAPQSYEEAVFDQIIEDELKFGRG